MFSIFFVIFLCAVFGLTEPAFVDTLAKNKCSINDGDCQGKLYGIAFKEIAKTGLPEYGLPPFDPYEIKNISVPILGLVEIGMVDGVAKGIRNCQFSPLNTTIENFHSTMEVLCDVTVKGRYRVLADNPLIKNLLGGATVHGEGYAKVKLEKMRILCDFNFKLREENEEIYITWDEGSSSFQYEFGKVTFAVNNLYFGNVEVSQTVINLMNENWKFLMTTFGKPFADVGMKISEEHAHKFFDAVPTSVYLTDDMSIYLQN